MTDPDRGWQCSECGYLRTDLAHRSSNSPMPCPDCGRNDFRPVVRKRKGRPEGR